MQRSTHIRTIVLAGVVLTVSLFGSTARALDAPIGTFVAADPAKSPVTRLVLTSDGKSHIEGTYACSAKTCAATIHDGSFETRDRKPPILVIVSSSHKRIVSLEYELTGTTLKLRKSGGKAWSNLTRATAGWCSIATNCATQRLAALANGKEWRCNKKNVCEIGDAPKAPRWTGVKTFRTERENEGAPGLAITPQGEVVMGGFTVGGLFGKFKGTVDMILAKLGTSGNTVWSTQLGSPFGESVSALAVLSNGDISVAGRAEGDFLKGTDELILYKNVFIARLRPDGSFVWTKITGVDGASSHGATQLAVDSRDNIYVAFSLSRVMVEPYSGDDIAVLKLDGSGAVQWTTEMKSAGDDSVNGMAVAADGIVLTGQAHGSFEGQPMISKLGGTYARDCWFAKLDASGKKQLVKQFGTEDVCLANAVAAHANGDTVVAGYFNGTFASSKTQGTHDAFVTRFDKKANPLWTKRYGAAQYDSADGLSAAPDGSTVAVGYHVIQPSNRDSNGHTVIWLARLAANGDQVIYKEFGRKGTSNLAEAVAIDREGNYVVSGTNVGGWSADRPGKDTDIVVFRVDATGNVL